MGLIWTLVVNGTLGLGGYWAARHGFRQPPGLVRGLAAATLAWAWATVGMEVLGPLGWLSREPLWLWATLGLAIAAGLRRSDRRRPGPVGPSREPAPGGSNWSWASRVALGLVIWASTTLGVNSLLLPVKVVSDGPIYHLYFAARWWKEGRLSLIATPFGENAATYFPAVGDLWFTWLMASWGGDRLAKVGQAPFLLLAGLAAFAMARRLGAGTTAAVVATAWFVTSTPLILFSFEPNVDTIFIAGYVLAAFFFLRYALGDGGLEALALGALAAGGALGTKATGVVFVPALLVLAAIAVLKREAPWPERARHLVVLAVAPLVMAGFWFARNAWLTGNPLYPLHLTFAGRVILPGWYDSSVMRLSKYYIPFSSGRLFGDTVLAVVDPRLFPLWLAALLGAWALGRGRGAQARWVWGASALAILNVGLYWGLIPYRTQQRFMLHALGLAVIPLARLLEGRPRLTVVAVVLLAAHVLTPQGWPFADHPPPWRPDHEPPWDLSPLIPNAVDPVIALPRSPEQFRILAEHPELLIYSVPPLGVGLASIAVAWLWSRARSRPGGRGFVVASCASLGLVTLAGALLVSRGADPRRGFYPGFADYLAGWLDLELRYGPSGSRIAYAGTNIPYYLLGVGLRNEVRYVNVDARRDWLLHDYHREAQAHGQPTWPHPRPGWDRIHPDYGAWLENLRAERIRILVVARANPDEGPHNLADPQGFPVERQWAERHPETFEPLYGAAENDPNLRVYRLKSSGG